MSDLPTESKTEMTADNEINADQATDITKNLTADQLIEAKQLSQSLTVTDQNSVLEYGKDAQQNLSKFSDTVLVKVQNKDLGEIGDSLRTLVTSLNSADPQKLSTKGSRFLHVFSKLKASLFEMTAKYQEVSAQIDRTANQLTKQETLLLDDNKTLQEMFDANMDFYQSLNVLIAGGKMRQQQLATEISELKSSLDPNDQMGTQKLQDSMALQDRLDKRINDLLLTREIAIQQAPQIRLIQNTNEVLAEKIQSSVTTAIPLWKNQVTIALTLIRQKDAVATQTAVADTTNDLLKKNSEMLKQSTIETAKASQRGIVDIDTLQQTQDNLISAVQETLAIQKDGSEKRQVAEQQLKSMEGELQSKLTNIEPQK